MLKGTPAGSRDDESTTTGVSPSFSAMCTMPGSSTNQSPGPKTVVSPAPSVPSEPSTVVYGSSPLTTVYRTDPDSTQITCMPAWVCAATVLPGGITTRVSTSSCPGA